MFETALISSRGGTGRRKLPLVLAAAVGHLALVGGILAAQLWTIAAVPEPVFHEVYVDVVLPPWVDDTPPAAAAAPKPDRATVDPRPLAPTPAPQLASLPETQLSPPEDVAQSDIPQPCADCPQSGPVTAPAIGAGGGDGGGEPDSDGIYNYTEGSPITPPVPIRKTQPAYTVAAIKGHIQGDVRILATIDASGRILDAQLVSDLPMGLGDSALEAIRQWTFQPARLAGRPIAVRYVVVVRFRLNQG
ncbi:MAG: TonB family protein [Thermoanaerobaculia bacterium]